MSDNVKVKERKRKKYNFYYYSKKKTNVFVCSHIIWVVIAKRFDNYLIIYLIRILYLVILFLI